MARLSAWDTREWQQGRRREIVPTLEAGRDFEESVRETFRRRYGEEWKARFQGLLPASVVPEVPGAEEDPGVEEGEEFGSDPEEFGGGGLDDPWE